MPEGPSLTEGPILAGRSLKTCDWNLRRELCSKEQEGWLRFILPTLQIKLIPKPTKS